MMRRTVTICTCIVVAALVVAALPAAAQAPDSTDLSGVKQGPVRDQGPRPVPNTDTVILWDNGDTDGSNGYSNGVPGVFAGFRRTVMDDFEVPAGETWDLTDFHFIHVWGTPPGGVPLGTDIELTFRDDAGGMPGAPFATATTTGYSEVPTGRTFFSRGEMESWLDYEPITLGEGTYWVEWNIVGPENDFALIKAVPVLADCWVDYEDLGGFQSCITQFGVGGDFSWYLTGKAGGGGVPNDTCDNKVEVTCDSITAGTNIGAGDEDDPDCGTGLAGASVWYSIDNVPFNANITASFCKPGSGADFDTDLSVYDGGCGALNCVVGNDDTCGLQSEVVWAANAGERYEIRVSGFGGAEGNFDLAVNCEALCDGIALDGPAKVTAGENFDLNVSCANPDTKVLVSGGRDLSGSSRFVPGCGVVNWEIGPRPNNFGTTLSDANGDATSKQNLGENFGNESICYQVLDQSKCETSNAICIDVNKAP